MNSGIYRNYLLAILAIILGFNYVDRLVLGLVLQAIKADLSVSDTQLGLLTGIAFALFYAVMGIPIARLADRFNRVTIIAVTTALWSVAVVLCGTAGSFVQLLLVRIAVAVGEAGCIPPAHSLLADYFERSERPRAVARYMLGNSLSLVLGYFLAGWLNEFYGWRKTFMLLGPPGIALAVLAALTLRDPRRAPDNAASTRPRLQEVFATLLGNRSFRHLLLCVSITYFFGYGLALWQPTFFIRTYGLGTGELGTWFTLIFGLGGFVGTYSGGEWASRRAANNERLQLAAMAAVYASFGAISACTYLSPNKMVALVFMGLGAVGINMTNGPLFATIQTLVPERMRAMSIAVIYLFANLIGMGLGPLAAGALSDALSPVFGASSLRYALLSLSPGYLWCAWHLWRASRTVADDLRKPLATTTTAVTP